MPPAPAPFRIVQGTVVRLKGDAADVADRDGGIVTVKFEAVPDWLGVGVDIRDAVATDADGRPCVSAMPTPKRSAVELRNAIRFHPDGAAVSLGAPSATVVRSSFGAIDGNASVETGDLPEGLVAIRRAENSSDPVISWVCDAFRDALDGRSVVVIDPSSLMSSVRFKGGKLHAAVESVLPEMAKSAVTVGNLTEALRRAAPHAMLRDDRDGCGSPFPAKYVLPYVASTADAAFRSIVGCVPDHVAPKDVPGGMAFSHLSAAHELAHAVQYAVMPWLADSMASGAGAGARNVAECFADAASVLFCLRDGKATMAEARAYAEMRHASLCFAGADAAVHLTGRAIEAACDYAAEIDLAGLTAADICDVAAGLASESSMPGHDLQAVEKWWFMIRDGSPDSLYSSRVPRSEAEAVRSLAERAGRAMSKCACLPEAEDAAATYSADLRAAADRTGRNRASILNLAATELRNIDETTPHGKAKADILRAFVRERIMAATPARGTPSSILLKGGKDGRRRIDHADGSWSVLATNGMRIDYRDGYVVKSTSRDGAERQFVRGVQLPPAEEIPAYVPDFDYISSPC